MDEAPIRSELWSVERLEQHARSLAAAQPVLAHPSAGTNLAARLRDNETVLLQAYRQIAAAATQKRTITPAAEWLLDNYHIVEQQVRQIRIDLPRGYYRQLPKLSDGPLAGSPRVFGVAWAYVAHTDSRFDPASLTRFLCAYQSVQPLTIGELWAVAISLRLVLVENLRRLVLRLTAQRRERDKADLLVDRLLGVNEQAQQADALLAYGSQPLRQEFLVQLIHRLRDHDPTDVPAVRWLEERLLRDGLNADELLRNELQLQGASNVTVRNIITSMRLMSDVDWTVLFEAASPVDEILRQGSAFGATDFATRNLYRDAIEQITRGTPLAEVDIARQAMAAAAQAPAEDDERQRDPGYHLIGGGRAAFERAVAYTPPFSLDPRRLLRRFLDRGISAYLGLVAGIAALMLALPLIALHGRGIGGWTLGCMVLLGTLSAIEAALAIVNRLVTTLGATRLPGLDLQAGVPAHLRTLVAVPTLLTDPAATEELVARLEVHYLANPGGALHFALLTDWPDASSETMEADAPLLTAARAHIARLNARYPQPDGAPRFLLLHRRRLWNEAQGCWMGWERKRGKLHELNRLLRGATDTTFIASADSPAGGPGSVPSDVRYVVTLDADTRLPRDTVRRLVAKMAHPLNRPRADLEQQRIVEGYGILQPRVTPSLPVGTEGSRFQRVFAANSGIDPYASAVSDVYQDLFKEGSYTGKGIYDVDAFELALAGRIPDNTLLSHDLFEGTFARAGLASDIEVIEDYPARYDVASARQHRWARGDWQLLPWIAATARATGGAARRALPALGWWKMVDNLRRSLSAPATFVTLIAGWLLPLPAALVWTGFVILVVAIPTVLPLGAAVLPRNASVALPNHLRALGIDLRNAFLQTVTLIVLLPHQAWLMTDAIARTLHRVHVSHRRLLDWTTAAQAQASVRFSLSSFHRQMLGGLAFTTAAAAVLAVGRAWHTLPITASFLAVWALAPTIAFLISAPIARTANPPVSAADRASLRLVARRTWRYFETFVTHAENHLPPDNFQEDPKPVVAHRTSPTNIGLYLLSVTSAVDFAWIGVVEATRRLEATIATMGRLRRHRGHLFNWYDTRDLHVLDPAYVSSVDSGNLAGHLIALANALDGWRGGPKRAVDFRGVRDALRLAQMALSDKATDGATPDAELAALETSLAAALVTVSEAPRLDALAVELEQVETQARRHAVGEAVYWCEAARRSLESLRADVALGEEDEEALDRRLRNLETTVRASAIAMDFTFLLDTDRLLLSIGYAAAEDKLDPGCYDLLASEARLASLVAIAKGDAPTRHWFRLGREMTPLAGGAALISWSGSMFEYLMPSLVMRAPRGSLLEEANDLVVRRQIDYAAAFSVPWGISESAYNTRDTALNYQYSNFGVPGLGFKRGLSENLVVAPYATALAAMSDAAASVVNFARFAAMGMTGTYGFYESVDFTPSRLPEGERFAIIRAFMAHHQGMTIVALANTVFDGLMRARFHGDPLIQAADLLLQERAPRDVAVAHPRAEEVTVSAAADNLQAAVVRQVYNPHAASPSVHLMSNGRYSTVLTAAGSGYSRWNNLAVTRWHEDATRDDWGSYLFLRDIESGHVWSPTYQPTGTRPDDYSALFAEDRVEFARREGAIATLLVVTVSPEADAELRRLTVTNESAEPLDLEVTSYAELVLAPAAADTAHQAFSKMFVETELLAGPDALLATRRRRSPDEPEIWAAHMAVTEAAVESAEHETDRARFLGRGNGIEEAAVLFGGRALSGSVGRVLDPVFSLRRRLRLAPGGIVHIAFWTMAAGSRAAILDLVDRHQDIASVERATTLAWTQAQVQLRHLGSSSLEASLFQRTAGHVLYANPALRSSKEAIQQGMASAPALWAHGISGDVPIVLVRIADPEEMPLVREMLRAFEYWQLKGLATDLVILNERGASYVQDLQVAIETMARSARSSTHLGTATAGAVFTLRSDLISGESRRLLLAVARVVLIGRRGSLADQLNRVQISKGVLPPRRRKPPIDDATARRPPLSALAALQFFNGFGGFSPNGREYVTVLGPGQATPAPWINVVSNSSFGFQVAADGGGYTWSRNSRDNQLTPWSNDPVCDRPGEILYVRDLDDGSLWTPTAGPIRLPGSAYIARHGWGYSRFEVVFQGIALSLLQFVPLDDSLKISRLTIRNLTGRHRRLSVTAYVEWVLGLSRGVAAATVVTDSDEATGALLARNPWNIDHGERVAFLDLGGRQTGWTADRSEFIGRNCTSENPAALSGTIPLSGHVGGGLDPCGVQQTEIELDPGTATEIVVLLGQRESAGAARASIERWREEDLDAAFLKVTDFWVSTVAGVEVRTPDPSMNVLLNGWLLYQTLACRVWARSAFYQASGAYGFRDQLQDVMSLTTTRPDLTRAQILRAAGRQFLEGDVQHWWFEPSGRGVRTRISDDRAWLAYVTAHYIETTGDAGILDERVPFLDGPPLKPTDHDLYFEPERSDETGSLFEHCARGLDLSLATGTHGLPLIGTGDWNDGMNRVGERGRGESVWLAWFLCATFDAFSPHAEARDPKRANAWAAHGRALRRALDADGWDGAWYRRGFYDDGTPLGSAANEECRIDSIAQSWAAISGAGDPKRAAQAMAALDEHLVRRADRLSLLFTPPFDHGTQDPGYVKGYPPGVRENGGQYTHAAAWAIMGFAALGQGDKATELFSLVNPVNHTASREGVLRYRVEPYVIAADVYSVSPHVGRGGWTWYTGSAGWLLRAGLEAILGIRRKGDVLVVAPCIPRSWPGFDVALTLDGTTYDIRVDNPRSVSKGVVAVTVDGHKRTPIDATARLDLERDQPKREVRIVLG